VGIAQHLQSYRSPHLTQSTTYIPIPPSTRSLRKTKLSKQIILTNQGRTPSVFTSYTKAMSDSTPSHSGPGIGGQALLKRRLGTSIEDFRNHYIYRHAPIAIPWCLANGVSYYAQVSVTDTRIDSQLDSAEALVLLGNNTQTT
jgi:hypothetical protein